MKVKLESKFHLTNSAYHLQKKPNWRLFFRDENRTEIRIPPVRGDQRLNIELELDSGYYIISLGTGTVAYERNFFVTNSGDVKWFEKVY